MNADTQTIVSAECREADARAMHNAGKSRTPAEDIAEALREAALTLDALALLADMPPANSEAAKRETAAMFCGFLAEVCRPLDDMFRQILRTAADNLGSFSPLDQAELERSRIVTNTIHDNWLCFYKLVALGRMVEAPRYQQQYARELPARIAQVAEVRARRRCTVQPREGGQK